MNEKKEEPVKMNTLEDEILEIFTEPFLSAISILEEGTSIKFPLYLSKKGEDYIWSLEFNIKRTKLTMNEDSIK